jgi:starch synthase
MSASWSSGAHPVSAVKPSLTLAADASEGEGGQGLNLQHMIEGLRDDFELRVYCRAARSTPAAEVPGSKLVSALYRIPIVRRRRDWWEWIGQTHFDRFVARHLSRTDLFQGATGQSALSLRRARALGMRTVVDSVTTHAEDFHAVQRLECDKFGVALATGPLMLRRVLGEYHHADVIRVMSEHARRTFLARGFEADRVIAARPFLDTGAFPRATFSEPAFRVVYVGMIEPWKGFHYLIDAFGQAAAAGSELIFWGGPGNRRISRYLAMQQARIPGLVVRPQSVRRVGFHEVYARASVLVHPSLSDGFGYVVAEAMACGLPVIVTSATGAAELVRDGYNGFVVPPGNTPLLAERIAYLARRRDLLPAMGANARHTIETEMTRARFREVYAGGLCRILK